MSTPGKTVLMVMTSYDAIDADHPTGLWLEEFAAPWQLFLDAGCQVTVASIQGGSVPLDPRSLVDDEKMSSWHEAVSALQQTVPLNSLIEHRYDAIFLPGGHGTMFDLPENPTLQGMLRHHYENDRVVAAVCHGPAGLIDVTLSDGSYLVTGNTLTAFTDAEERAAQLVEMMPFLLESELRQRGANFKSGDLWSSHVETDGKLVTGQNPASSAAAAEAVLNLL